MTEPQRHLHPADEADLAALADGRLDARRRAELEARVAAEPSLAAALARQRRGLGALAACAPAAPPALRCRIGALKARPPRRRLPALLAALAVAAAALVAAVASPAPVLGDVLDASARPATGPARAGEQVEGHRFPARPGWRRAGARSDRVHGRHARTVFYERRGQTVAYTIVAGPPLVPAATPSALDAPDGRAAVAWTERGHTCVLASAHASTATLAELAAW